MSDYTTMAGTKAALAELGQTLRHDAQLTHRPKPTQASSVVILDRVVKDELPDYCIHGYATCARCDHMVWLGHKTVEAVNDGAAPLCLPCAYVVIEPGAQPVENLGDHRRADGPHED